MSMGDYTPRGDAALRGFARQIARLKRDLRILETAAQGAYRSVEEGSVDFYDEDGVLRERVGKQKDGSYGRVTLEGPVPPTPSEPDVVVIDNGVVAITWDGRCEEKWPFAEFRNVRVHLGDTATFTPTRANQVGTIHAHRGGTIVAVTESDDDNPVYVRLVAVSTAGHASDPSPAVLVDELDADRYDEQEELQWEDGDGHTITSSDITSGSATIQLTHDPEVESIFLSLGPLAQEPSEYTIDYDNQRITFPLSGKEDPGDRIWVHYAYQDGGGLSVPLGYVWKYATGLGSSTTYAATGFDDSAWASGPSPFGWREADYAVTAAEFGTLTPSPMDVWTRIHVTTSGGDLTFTVGIDDDATVYLDGTLVGTYNVAQTEAQRTVTVPAAAGSHVVAIHGTDTGVVYPGAPADEGGYLGVTIYEGG